MPISTGTESATIRFDPAGKVTAVFGVASHGQGLETTLAQIVADEVGVPIDDVRVLHGDTEVSPYGTGTYASRSLVLAGGAAILAGPRGAREDARDRRPPARGRPGRRRVTDGRYAIRGMPDRSVTVRDVARTAYAGVRRLPAGLEPGLEATRFYDPYYGTASNATHVAVVEVDRATCEVKTLRYLVVEDCGRMVNPLIVDGQVHGGVAQGLGAALLEEIVYDELGPAPERHPDGLRGALGLRGPEDGGAPPGDAVAGHARRLPRHGRGRDDRRARRDRQRHRRRAGAAGDRGRRAADDAPTGSSGSSTRAGG